MKRTIGLAIVVLLTCIAVLTGLDQYQRLHHDQAITETLDRQLPPFQARLQARLDGIVAENRTMAAAIATQPDLPVSAVTALAQGAVARQPRLLSVLVAHRLKVGFVYPAKGNEAVIGLDYALHPEFMGSINRAIATRDTVVDAPVSLMQTGRPGLVIRTPMFDKAGDLSGLISMAVDIEGLLIESGLLEPTLDFSISIEQHTNGQPPTRLFGTPDDTQHPTSTARIILPDGVWTLSATTRVAVDQEHAEATLLWPIGGGLTLLLVLLILWRGGVLKLLAEQQGDRPAGKATIRVRTLMILAVVVPTPVLIGGVALLFYHTSMQAADHMEQQQVNELAEQVREQVSSFFAIPRQVAAFNADLFRYGLLDPSDPVTLQTTLLAQFRQQPLLTFLSIGTAEGDYYAASRPPRRDDKTLRLLRATTAEGREMKLFRVDDTNQPSQQVPTSGNAFFDARTRPWYQAALNSETLKWYPAYRYGIDDPNGLYDAIGIGMSAPLYSTDHRFLGVIAADVSLSQLGAFLHKHLSSLGGVAFLAEHDGTLLASSDDSAIYHLDDTRTLRIRADQSDTPAIRTAGAIMRAANSPADSRSIEVNGQRHLLNWQSLQLPDGPLLTIALVMPEHRLSNGTGKALHTVGSLLLVVLILGGIAALAFSYWFTQPLLALDRWARHLGAGEWNTTLPVDSAISELSGLSHSLGTMATQLQRHAAELEQKVAERTQELADANRRLAQLSRTDGLTGLANRRHLDETFANECARAHRSGQALAVMLIDVDLFKPYNDLYGHPEGDEALRQVATVLQSSCRRASDLAARYGGEEFCVLMADTDPAGAMALAEHIRGAVEALSLPHEKSACGVVTISIGVASWLPAATPLPVTEQTLLRWADQALYRAKEAGRNRVVVHESSQENHPAQGHQPLA